MNRRNAIKSMAWATSGVLALSYCSPLPDLAYSRLDLKQKDRKLLIYLSLTILEEDPINFPTMETREAFVLGWLNDILSDDQLKSFVQGFKGFQSNYSGDFSSLGSKEQKQLITDALTAENLQADFMKQLKNISVLHFRTTEHYMTEYLNYEFIPGRYFGCKNRVEA